MALTSQFQGSDEEATGECAECTSTGLHYPQEDESSNIPLMISEHNILQ